MAVSMTTLSRADDRQISLVALACVPELILILTLPQVPWPQVVLFGDSLFQASAQILDGFAFQAALQERISHPLLT